MSSLLLPELQFGGAFGKRFRGGAPIMEQIRVDRYSIDEVREVGFAVVKSVEYMSFIFKKLGLPGQFDTSRLEQRIKHPDKDFCEHMHPVLDGKYKGALTKENILTIANVIRCYYDCEKNICLWGPCQGAKTLVYLFLMMLLPVLEKQYRGRILIPIVNVPNDKNLMKSVNGEFRTLLHLYSDVEFIYDGEWECLDYLKRVILKEILAEAAGDCLMDSSLIIKRDPGRVNFIADQIRKLQKIVRSVSKTSLSKEDGKDASILSFSDEIHYGSEKNGIADRLEGSAILDACAAENIDPTVLGSIRCMGVTATPSEVIGAKNWIKVPMWVPLNYQGVTTYNGESLPTISGERPSVQKIVAIEDAFPALAKYLDTSLWKNQGDFYASLGKRKVYEELDSREKKQVAEFHMEYKEGCARALYDAYVSSVTRSHGIFFARVFKENKYNEELMQHLKKVHAENGNDPDYQFLKYFGELSPEIFGDGGINRFDRTIKEVLLDRYVSKDQYCMVIAGSGRSRMGDSYPRQCANYMDWVEHSVTWNAIMQSTFGRSQGFGKQSTCYFQRAYAEELKAFLESGCVDRRLKRKKFGPRTEYGEPQAGRQSQKMKLTFL